MDVICLMGVYDMNGKQGPNQVGKDIGFVGSFYNGYETKSATVLPHSKEIKYDQTELSGNSWDRLSKYCENLDKDKNWIMPDINELSLIFLNVKLINHGSTANVLVSRTPRGKYFRHIDFGNNGNGFRGAVNRNDMSTWGPYVRCVRRTQMK